MESIEDGDSTPDLKLRLAEAWKVDNIAETCGVLVDEVRPRCVKWLLSSFSNLSIEDCEDCFNDGVEGLLKRKPEHVNDPYNYVFTSAKNAAFDILRERKLIVQYNPDWYGDEDSTEYWSEGAQSSNASWPTEAMLIVAEVALDVEIAEITVRDEQLRTAFQATLPKLVPNRRRLVEVLLEHGANIANAVLADIMDSTETAVKSLKSRTFDDLRHLIPVAAGELGINFDILLAPEPEALVRNPVIPSEEDDAAFVP